MKALSIALSTLLAAASLGTQAWASNVVTTVRMPAPGYRGAGGHGKGICGSFGRHRGDSRGYAAAPVVQQVVTEDVFRPCLGGGRFDGGSKHRCRSLPLVGVLDHQPQHCYPNCYIGTPCTCCDHTLRTVRHCSL